jgi:uncharacterized protein involved in outer membrane biogenesis
MSEDVPTPPAEPSRASIGPTQAPPTPEKKPRKWRRRITRTLIVILLLALALRVGLFYAIRPVLRKVAAAYNVDITFDRQEVTLAAADVGFNYIKVTPRGGGAPLLQTDYLRGHISLWELLHGRLHVYRAEADGVDLTLERNADGRIPLLEQLTSGKTSPPPPKETEPGKPIEFKSPLTLEAFRLHHVHMKLRDASVSPALEALLAMDVRVSNLGDRTRPVTFEADIWSDPALDVMRVSGQGKGDGKNIDAALTVFMRGLHLKPLAGYLASAGVRPYENDLGLKMTATLKTEPVPSNPNGIKATLAVDRLDVASEAHPVASVQSMQIVADEIDPTAAKIGSVKIDGVRAHASRDERGILRVAGLEFVGGATAKQSAPPTTAPAYQVSLRDVSIRDVQADLRDATVSPPTDFRFVLNQLTSSGGAINPNDPDSVIPIDASMSLPGLVQTMTLKGQCKPYAADKTFDVSFVADGIRPDLARPYLADTGIESLLKSAKAEGKLSAVIHPNAIDANISNLRLTDGGELASMPQVRITGLGTDAKSGRTRIAAIELTGPAIDLTRDAEGRLVVAGVRYSPQTQHKREATNVAKNSLTPTSAATKPVFADVLPRFEIDRLSWQGVHLHFRDEQRQPPTNIAIDDAGIEGSDLLLDLREGAETKPGKLKMYLASPGVAKRFEVDATVNTALGKLAAEFTVRGDGLQTKSLAPYLKPLGIEPVLNDGALQLDGDVSLERQTDRLAASLTLRNTKFSDGATELGGLDQLRIADVSVAGGNVEIKSVELTRPRINVARDADGALAALGVRIVPATQPSAAPAPATAPSPAVAATAPSTGTVFSLGDLRIDDAQLGWSDRMTKMPANLKAHASVQASNIVLGKPAEPLSFRATLAVDDLVKEATAAGRFDPTPGALSFIAALEAKGVGGRAIAPYLPPGMELATKDGRFQTRIEAEWAKQPQGGNRGKLIVEKLDWRDGEKSAPLAAFDGFVVIASRIDPAGDVFTVDEVTLAGLATGAQLEKDGATRALGLIIRTPKPEPSKAAENNHAELASAAMTTTAPSESSTNVAQLVTEGRRPLPLITLQKLDVNVKSAKLENRAIPEAAPIELQNVSLRNSAPITLGGPSAASQPPIKLLLAGKVSPVVDRFQVATEAAPFATTPAVRVELSAAGIRGKGVADLITSLREQLNGDALVDGRFGAKLAATIKYDRRGPRDFDLSRGFQVDFTLDQMQFRDGETGPVLAGLDAVRAEKVRVEPINGNVYARLVELEKPQFRAMRDAEGIHALGFLIPMKQATTAPTETAQTPERQSSPSMAEAPPSAPQATTKPASEIRIDRLTLTGLDVRIEDRVVQPPTIIPLNNMDLEVRDFTTLALVEPRTIRFTMTMNADKVPLPVAKKDDKGGGIIGAIGAVASGEKKSHEQRYEDRELLSQIAATGQIGLYPKPSGYVRGSANGIELAGFEGEARQAGVGLTGGIYDGNFDIRFDENGTMHARTKSVVTDLELTEPPNGAVSKAIKSPAPLDVVVKALQDPSGAITVPLDVSVEHGDFSGGAIAGAAVAALGPIMGTAVASAPVKVVAGATELIGIGKVLGGKDKKKQHPPVEIAFAPGSTELDPHARGQLAQLVEDMGREKKMQVTIRHEIGGDDVSILSARANPSKEDCLALIAQLRARKSAANDERAKLAGQVEAQLASAAGKDSASALQQLREKDQQIAELETSLDQLLDLLRPGADRQATRRTRAACLQISAARTQAVQRLLVNPRERISSDRIHVSTDRMSEPPAPHGRVIIIVKE